MEARDRWWNGVWGRIGRRDIWLLSDGDRWVVRGRLGGDEGHEVTHHFDNEDRARDLIKHMMALSAGTWRSLLDPIRRESRRRQVGN
ncbi:hypothetical protein OG836_24480 [Micromonospora zamorensis]|uniref:hypothetical protein n=1 Tax=Micromonospora zamorensis TaxID=709883 RepID=UPI002E1BC0A6